MSPLDDEFLAFANENPHVEDRLARLALDLKNRGYERCSIAMLFEVLRWQTMMQTSEGAAGGFKLNNNYRAFYARLLMDKYPPLRGFFETREQHFPVVGERVNAECPTCAATDALVVNGGASYECQSCVTRWARPPAADFTPPPGAYS